MSEIFAPGSIAGPVGPTGPPVTFTGPYSTGTTYAAGEAASSAGSSYVSLIAGNVGHDPATSPTQWSVLAAAGVSGTNGSNGSNGSNGAPGAPGSATAVSALAGAVMPAFVGRNLFDSTKVTGGMMVDRTTGLLAGQGADNAAALIYCPGATSMASNLPIDGNNFGGGICLYDANGTFTGVVSDADLGAVVSGHATAGWGSVTLPGTQTYIRFGYIPSWQNQSSNGWAYDATAMVFMTTTGTAALPGTYQPCGIDTIANVNTKIATAMASRTASVDRSIATLESYVFPPNANRWDPSAIQTGFGTNNDGTLGVLGNVFGSGVPGVSGFIYCPGATTLVYNMSVIGPGQAGDAAVQLFDSLKNFMGVATFPLSGYGGQLTPHTILPGTQTYVRFTYITSNDTAQGGMPSSGMVFVGSSTNIPALVTATRLTPFFAPQVINPFLISNIKKATELGAVASDVVDCAAIFNAFLATASATNPIKLILDGKFSIWSPLYIAATGYTTIEGIGWGSGIRVKGGNTDYSGPNMPGCIAVGGTGQIIGTNTPVVAPARLASNIAFRNFIVEADATYYSQFLLQSCSNVVVENIRFTSTNSGLYDYFLQIGNANQIFVRGCTFVSGGTTHDGIHINGKTEDITISDCYFATGDDAIALNAPEGWTGDISRVTITNCRFNGSLTAMRIFASDAGAAGNINKVRNVVVSNCTGHVAQWVFNLGAGAPFTNPDQLQDFSASNCTFSAPGRFAYVGTPSGSITFRGIKFIPSSAQPVVVVDQPVGELTLEDFTVLRNPDGYSAPGSFVLCENSGAVNVLSLSHCRVVDELGSAYTALPCLLDILVAVNIVRLDDIDLNHITALTSDPAWATVTSLTGNGVLGTGAAVPDGVMANNSLYLSSAASGAPSIKVGGVAKRLTLV